MHLPALLARFRRPTALFAFALATLGVASSVDLHAQTAADLTPAALVGKSIECTIVSGVAPFETRGFFVIQLGGGSYSIDAASGNATYRSGTYTATAGSGSVTIRLGNYLVNNFAVEIELYAIGSPTVDPESGLIYLLTTPGEFVSLDRDGNYKFRISMMDCRAPCIFRDAIE